MRWSSCSRWNAASGAWNLGCLPPSCHLTHFYNRRRRQKTGRAEREVERDDEGARVLLQALCVICVYINYSPWCFCPGTGLSFTRHPEINQENSVTATGWCQPGSPHPLPKPPPSSLDTERDVRHHARRESTVLGIRVQHTMRWLLEARSSFTITKCIIPSTVLYATFP